MATWIEKYEVVPALDKLRGPHFEVVSKNNRGTRKVVHRYKSQDVADKIRAALVSQMNTELP